MRLYLAVINESFNGESFQKLIKYLIKDKYYAARKDVMISPLLYRKTPTVRHQQRASFDEKNWAQIYTRNPSAKQAINGQLFYSSP